MKKKPFVKNNKLYLGGKKQKGGSFLLGASLGIPFLSKLLLGKGKRKKKKKKKMVRRRNNIVLVKRNSPHKVTFPNGRTFYAKYRRVTKEYLPGSIKIARTYKGRPVKITKAKNKPPTYAAAVRRLPAWLVCANPNQPIARPSGSGSAILNIVNRKRKQKGRGISDVARTVANNPYVQEISKKLLSKGINCIPSLFRRGSKKIKNKRLKQIAQSEIVADLIDKGTTKLHGRIGL